MTLVNVITHCSGHMSSLSMCLWGMTRQTGHVHSNILERALSTVIYFCIWFFYLDNVNTTRLARTWWDPYFPEDGGPQPAVGAYCPTSPECSKSSLGTARDHSNPEKHTWTSANRTQDCSNPEIQPQYLQKGLKTTQTMNATEDSGPLKPWNTKTKSTNRTQDHSNPEKQIQHQGTGLRTTQTLNNKNKYLTFTYRSFWLLTSTDQNEVMEHAQFMLPPAGALSDRHPSGGGEGVLALVPLGLTRHNVSVDSLIERKPVFAMEIIIVDMMLKKHLIL